MPQRILTYSRTEPARTILWVVALMTLLAQAGAMVIDWPVGIANFAIVGPVCLWGIWSSSTNKMKHMSRSSFALFLIWFWSGLMRLLIAPDPTMLLWVPFLVVSACMGVVYLYLSHQRVLVHLANEKEVVVE